MTNRQRRRLRRQNRDKQMVKLTNKLMKASFLSGYVKGYRFGLDNWVLMHAAQDGIIHTGSGHTTRTDRSYQAEAKLLEPIEEAQRLLEEINHD